MDKLSTAKRVQIVKALVEGNSLRSTTRMIGASINTVTKLLVDLGTACEAFHDEHVRNVPAKRVQCDEVWCFCYARRENVPEDLRGVFGYGDLWTWVGQDADSKLVLSWLVGRRDAQTAHPFMHDLASRLTSRVQLTTDGLHAYLEATDSAFASDIDYARLIKVYETLSSVGTWPHWLPDNRRLIFHHQDKAYLIDSQSKQVREILSVAPHAVSWQFGLSRDGQQIVFILDATEADVWQVNLE
jgi:hypothetical protein